MWHKYNALEKFKHPDHQSYFRILILLSLLSQFHSVLIHNLLLSLHFIWSSVVGIMNIYFISFQFIQINPIRSSSSVDNASISALFFLYVEDCTKWKYSFFMKNMTRVQCYAINQVLCIIVLLYFSFFFEYWMPLYSKWCLAI